MHVETVRRVFIDKVERCHFPALQQVFAQLAAMQDAERAD